MKAPNYASRPRAPQANETPRTARARLRRATACALTILLLCNAALGAAASAKGAKKSAPKAAKAAKVTDAKASAAKAADDGRVSFTLTVRGEGFGRSDEAVSLSLLDRDGDDALVAEETTFESVTPTKIVARVTASPGPYSLRLKVGKGDADTSALGPVAAVLTPRSRRAAPSPIEIEAPEVSAYASEGALRKYALVVKRKDGNFFETDPRLVSLSLTPAGAADVTIRRVTPTRVEADFWAQDGYKVRDVGVTVYDAEDPQSVVASSDVQADEGGDSDAASMLTTSAGGAQKPKAPKPKANPDDEQPEIESTSMVFLQRAFGIGRLKIEGKNFGDYPAPPVSAEDYLLCYEPLARQALVRALQDDYPDPDAQRKLEDTRCVHKDSDRAAWEDWRKKVEPLVKVALVPRNTDLRIEQTKVLYIDDKMIDVYFEFNRYYRFSEPLRLASATVTVKKPWAQGDSKPAAPKAKQGGAETAGAQAQGTLINALMTSGGGGGGAAEEAKPAPVVRKTYIARKEVGTKQDENLEYRYTVLDSVSAETLFGRGVSHNFYVIQLSVTNKGEKKMAIPLASIQAEVEWAFGPKPDTKDGRKNDRTAGENGDDKGRDAGESFAAPAYVSAKDTEDGPKDDSKEVRKGNHPKGVSEEAKRDTKDDSKDEDGPKDEGGVSIPFSKTDVKDYYEEGPATLAPLPLAAVTAFFDGDEKVNGKKAKFFNITDGLATLGSSLIPFFGPGFKDAHVAFTGGLVPGIRRGLGDLSSQQLQTLTALSWQGVEVVAAKGGSVEKFVFIQRGDQVFSAGFGERLRKTIKNIEGMEVVGFEVIESEPKRAAPAGQQ
jgi:hypothetical protein